MKLISIRKGFQSDHSSTSYEFLAVDKKLTAAEKKAVSKLSSRACPTSKQVSFIYNGDWSDLPGGWEPLMEKYYDVMYSESYDWWTLAFAFNTDKNTIDKLRKFAFDGEEDLGVGVSVKKDRVIVTVFCRIGPDSEHFGDDYDDEYGYGFYEDEEDEERDNDNKFLKLLKQNREFLKKGDYRLLFGIWEQYGVDENDKNQPPEAMNKLPKATSNLLSMFESM